MFKWFNDCLIKYLHCFKLLSFCLFHVRFVSTKCNLSKPNADMECSNHFADCLKDPPIVQKEVKTVSPSWFIVSLVRKVSHFDAHCSKAFEKRCSNSNKIFGTWWICFVIIFVAFRIHVVVHLSSNALKQCASK